MKNTRHLPFVFYLLNHYKFSIILCSALLAVGCSSGENTPSNISPPSLSESSLSPKLQTNYTKTCAVCHTKPITGAPISGDTKQWEIILSKGMDKVLDRVINGYAGMPPGGQCFDCSSEELIELINFMAGKSKQATQTKEADI